MRDLFDDDHEAFRESFASFVANEMSPRYLEWEASGITPHEIFTRAGQYGFLGIAIPEEFGGGGSGDYRFNVVRDDCLTGVWKYLLAHRFSTFDG